MTRALRLGYVLFAAVLLTLPVRSFAQDSAPAIEPAKAKLIKELLKRTNAVNQTFAVMEQAIPAQRAANPKIPKVFWDRFQKTARSRRGELESIMMTVYDRHFSSEELQNVLAFYDTPTGKKMLKVTPVLTQELMVAGQEWGQRIGADVGEKLAAEGVTIEP